VGTKDTTQTSVTRDTWHFCLIRLVGLIVEVELVVDPKEEAPDKRH